MLECFKRIEFERKLEKRENRVNVYRTSCFIVFQRVFYIVDNRKMGSTFSEDTYYVRTPARDSAFDHYFGIDGFVLEGFRVPVQDHVKIYPDQTIVRKDY